MKDKRALRHGGLLEGGHVCLYVCTSLSLYIYVYVCICVHLSLSLYLPLSLYIYVYTDIHTDMEAASKGATFLFTGTKEL